MLNLCCPCSTIKTESLGLSTLPPKHFCLNIIFFLKLPLFLSSNTFPLCPLEFNSPLKIMLYAPFLRKDYPSGNHLDM